MSTAASSSFQLICFARAAVSSSAKTLPSRCTSTAGADFAFSPARIASADRVIAPLFSRRNAAHLEILLMAEHLAERVEAVGISAAVFGDGVGPWRRQAVADRPTLEAVVVQMRHIVEIQEAV